MIGDVRLDMDWRVGPETAQASVAVAEAEVPARVAMIATTYDRSTACTVL